MLLIDLGQEVDYMRAAALISVASNDIEPFLNRYLAEMPTSGDLRSSARYLLMSFSGESEARSNVFEALKTFLEAYFSSPNSIEDENMQIISEFLQDLALCLPQT